MELDLRMVLSVAITALLMSVVFHFQARSFPLNIKGIPHWSKSFALLSIAMLLVSTRNFMPWAFSGWLAYVVQQCAFGQLYLGMAEFHERKVHRALMVVPIAVSVTLLAVMTVLSAPVWMRIAVACTGNGLIMMPSLVILLLGRPGDVKFRFTKLFASGFFALTVFIVLFRAGWMLVVRPEAFPPIPPMVYNVLSLIAPSVVTAFSIGLSLLAFDRLKDELQYLVSHDALTGVYSRRGFLALAESEISRAVRANGNTTLLMLDLDHFKQINDRHGHPGGDLVLCKFVHIVKSCLRREDFVGRFGGEEFMVLLPDASPITARVVAERIRTATFASRLPMGHEELRFTVSVGIATARGAGESNLEELLKLADAALYMAKTLGRNRVEVA